MHLDHIIHTDALDFEPSFKTGGSRLLIAGSAAEENENEK
jgi:hypothetical protein